MVALVSRSPITIPKSTPLFIVVLRPSTFFDRSKEPETPSIGGTVRFGSMRPPIPFLANMFKSGVGYVILNFEADLKGLKFKDGNLNEALGETKNQAG